MIDPLAVTTRKFIQTVLLPLCLGAACTAGQAQTPAQTPPANTLSNTITVRMLDNRTGLLIATSNFLVRANHQQELHGDWMTQNEDGTGKLELPPNAGSISLHATYETATLTYVNCDADKDYASAEHAASLDRWYPVAKIMATGIVAPNNCIGKKVPEKLQVVAQPGEFVFFVRQLNAKEQFKD